MGHTMNIEQAREWARSRATNIAQLADAGDYQSGAQIELMAQAYLLGWMKRDIACKDLEIEGLRGQVQRLRFLINEEVGK